MCLLVVRQKNEQNYDVTSGNYDVISRYLTAEKRSHIKYLRCDYHIRYNRNMRAHKVIMGDVYHIHFERNMTSCKVIIEHVLVPSAVYLRIHTWYKIEKFLRIGPRKICPKLVFAASDDWCRMACLFLYSDSTF